MGGRKGQEEGREEGREGGGETVVAGLFVCLFVLTMGLLAIGVLYSHSRVEYSIK